MNFLSAKTKAFLADWEIAAYCRRWSHQSPDVTTKYRGLTCNAGADGYAAIKGLINPILIRKSNNIHDAKVDCIIAADMWLDRGIVLTCENYDEFCKPED